MTSSFGAWMSGCAPSLSDNPPREAKTELPGAFGPATGAGKEGPQDKSSGQASWREFFTEPELRALVDTALQNNQELSIQIQEIIIAQSEVIARKGENTPKVTAGVGAGVEKVGKTTSQGVSDEAHGVPENLGDFGFGLTGSWEVDIWKKLRNATAAAKERYLASIEGKNFVVTQLVAEIARSYYELLALDSQLDVLRRNVEIQAAALDVVKLQKEAARVTELAVLRFEAEVAKNKSRSFSLEQERVQAENRINFLLGRFPQPVGRDPARFAEPLPNVIRQGVPSALLDNRPDVRAAAHRLEAAKLDVKSTKAGFYPSLTLDAGLGYRSFDITHLVDTPESLAYKVAGGLTAPLLNRAAIEAQYKTANARQIQAVFEYERAILQAFTDTVNQLAKIENLKQSYDLQRKQVEELTRGIEVSNVLFLSARADYMEVLLTRRDALDAEMELIETKKAQLLAMVDVYQALGGGWK